MGYLAIYLAASRRGDAGHRAQQANTPAVTGVFVAGRE